MITICITNKRGGVAKTSTAVGLAVNLAGMGYNTLLIDGDSQGNTTLSAGGSIRSQGLYDVIEGKASINDCLQWLTTNLCLLSNGSSLENLEVGYANKPKRERLYKKVLEEVENDFKFAVIDTSPFLGVGALNALTASQYAIIPVKPELFSYQGLAGVLSFIENTRKYCNPRLTVAGILETVFDKRQTSTETFDELIQSKAKEKGINVFETKIRRSQALVTAQGKADVSIFTSKLYPGRDYGNLAAEFLEVIRREK